MEVRVKLKDRSMEVRALNNKHKYSQYFGWGITAFAVIAAGILLILTAGKAETSPKAKVKARKK